MLITKPSYFDSFRCIAGSCPDSCCKEWEVQVDPTSAAFYRSLTGPLGDRLREVLREEDGETVMTITDGRCPMWRNDGLCQIQAELGEGALCKTCREFPRLTHDYGDFVELGLELSCPEAARLILSAPWEDPIAWEASGGEAPEYDVSAMSVLKKTRREALSLVADTSRSVQESLALLLLYGYHAQEELDTEEALPFDREAALDNARSFAKQSDFQAIPGFFRNLEILTPGWRDMLDQAAAPVLTDMLRTLARYFIERYWLQAVSDYDLACRVKFILISCLLVSSLPGPLVGTAQLYSKEIENSIDNVEAVLDAAYADPTFTDDRLLGQILNS